MHGRQSCWDVETIPGRLKSASWDSGINFLSTLHTNRYGHKENECRWERAGDGVPPVTLRVKCKAESLFKLLSRYHTPVYVNSEHRIFSRRLTCSSWCKGCNFWIFRKKSILPFGTSRKRRRVYKPDTTEEEITYFTASWHADRTHLISTYQTKE